MPSLPVAALERLVNLPSILGCRYNQLVFFFYFLYFTEVNAVVKFTMLGDFVKVFSRVIIEKEMILSSHNISNN